MRGPGFNSRLGPLYFIILEIFLRKELQLQSTAYSDQLSNEKKKSRELGIFNKLQCCKKRNSLSGRIVNN